MVRQNNYFNIL